jgi:SAM-dependent methyltransferase
MDDYSAYETAEAAALYDAVFAGRDDAPFWLARAAESGDPVLELGCGTGRVLLPLARAGHEVTGIDLSAPMIEHCRAKLQREPAAVRARVRLLAGDMTSFDLGDRFATIVCPFGGFHHLRTVEQQLACLERCRAHLRPHGRLVLDLANPDPAPPAYLRDEEQTAREAATELVDWTDGRRVRSSMTITGYQRTLQCSECTMTYEVVETDGTTRLITETFPLRYVFRYELEHLLARSGFSLVALYGDYDGLPFAEESVGLIAVFEPSAA